MIPQIKNATNRAVDFFLDLLFPRFCLSCGCEGAYLCADCKEKLRGCHSESGQLAEKQSQLHHFPFCPLCKNKLTSCHPPVPVRTGTRSSSCHSPDFRIRGNPDLKCARKCKSQIKFALSPFSYDSPLIKDLIHNFKYNFIKSLGVDLADFMIESLKYSNLLNRYAAVPLNSFLIVPVPLHRRRLAWRGFNQSEILARQISEKLNIGFAGALKRTKNTKPQIEMASAEERQENIKNAFVLRRPKKFLSFPPPFLSFPWKRESRPKSNLDSRVRENDNKLGEDDRNDFGNKTVIIVDDMLTTGATLEECARILKQNGAREIWALTIAK